MNNVRLDRWPSPWPLVTAWGLVLLPVIAAAAVLASLAWPIFDQSSDLAAAKRQTDALSARIEAAEREAMTWFSRLDRSTEEIAAYADPVATREAFEAGYDEFLATVADAGLVTRRSGGIREQSVSDRVADFQASWAGRGQPGDFVDVLVGLQMTSLRVSNLSIRAAEEGAGGEVDIVVEFRRSVLVAEEAE